jgi:hypothetical protein
MATICVGSPSALILRYHAAAISQPKKNQPHRFSLFASTRPVFSGSDGSFRQRYTKYIMIRTCENCEKSFDAPVNNIRKGYGRFCSRSCGASFNGRIRVSYKRDTLHTTCDWCSTPFIIKPSRFKRSKSGLTFCSRSCKCKAQRIGGRTEIQPNHYGSDNASDYRSTALRFYKNRCADCHYDTHVRVLEVHHVDGNRSNNAVENLAVLCPICHRERHLGYRANEMVGVENFEISTSAV